MQTTARQAITRHARRSIGILALCAMGVLTACGGGNAPEQEQPKAPEITRVHKLSAPGADGSSALQIQVQSLGLIAQVSLVSTTAEGRSPAVIALAFKADGNSLTVQLPAGAALGGWMLVVTDDAGLSSTATVINLAG
jgi:hypothetical protein